MISFQSLSYLVKYGCIGVVVNCVPRKSLEESSTNCGADHNTDGWHPAIPSPQFKTWISAMPPTFSFPFVRCKNLMAQSSGFMEAASVCPR